MDPSDQLGLPFVLVLQCGGIGQPERTSERGARVRIRGEVVRLQVADDLQTMLEPAQEPIGVAERLGVGLRDVPLLGERGQRAQRVRLTQFRVATPMHDLQQLHRELHIADAASAALHLGELLAATADVLLQPNLRAADVVDRVGS